MDAQPTVKKFAAAGLAIVLWLATVILGLQDIYAVRDIFSLALVRLGGTLKDAEHFSPWLVLILGMFFVFFIIGTSEYHRKHVGQPASWRLFAGSLAVEAGILILYYIL